MLRLVFLVCFVQLVLLAASVKGSGSGNDVLHAESYTSDTQTNATPWADISDPFDANHAANTHEPYLHIDPYEALVPGDAASGMQETYDESLPWQAITLDYGKIDQSQLWSDTTDMASLSHMSSESTPLQPSSAPSSSRVLLFWKDKHPGFPPAQWQYRYLKDQVKWLFDKLAESWPDRVQGKVLDAHINRVNKWLAVNPGIVSALMEDDLTTWEQVKLHCLLDVNRQVAPRRSESKKKIKMIPLAWLARPILSDKKDFIIERLARHWGMDKGKEVHPRINRYVAKFGPITSPAPLWEANEDSFRRAADAIYCKDAPYGHRMVGAGDDDILHQDQPEDDASFNMDILQTTKRLRVNAARYHSGQAWLDEKTFEEIAAVQDTVRIYWEIEIDHKVMLDCFLMVNDFLENHRRMIDRILEGDQEAASYVAHLTRSKRVYKQYKAGTLSPEWYIEPPEQSNED